MDIGADADVKQEKGEKALKAYQAYTARGHKLHFSIHRKGRKEDNNFIEYFLCDLCAFAVNKN